MDQDNYKTIKSIHNKLYKMMQQHEDITSSIAKIQENINRLISHGKDQPHTATRVIAFNAVEYRFPELAALSVKEICDFYKTKLEERLQTIKVQHERKINIEHLLTFLAVTANDPIDLDQVMKNLSVSNEELAS